MSPEIGIDFGTKPPDGPPYPEWLEVSPVAGQRISVNLNGRKLGNANDICRFVGNELDLEKNPKLSDCKPGLVTMVREGTQIGLNGEFIPEVSYLKFRTTADGDMVIFTPKFQVPTDIVLGAITETSEQFEQIPTQTPEPSLDLYLKTNYLLIGGVALNCTILLGLVGFTYGYIRAGIRQSRE